MTTRFALNFHIMPRNGPISFAAVPEDIIFTILRFCFLPEYYALSMVSVPLNTLCDNSVDCTRTLGV